MSVRKFYIRYRAHRDSSWVPRVKIKLDMNKDTRNELLAAITEANTPMALRHALRAAVVWLVERESMIPEEIVFHDVQGFDPRGGGPAGEKGAADCTSASGRIERGPDGDGEAAVVHRWENWDALFDAHEAAQAELAEARRRIDELREQDAEEWVVRFAEAIEHGDDTHRVWLRQAAVAWVRGESIPTPRGVARTTREPVTIVDDEADCTSVSGRIERTHVHDADGPVCDWDEMTLCGAAEHYRAAHEAAQAELAEAQDLATKLGRIMAIDPDPESLLRRAQWLVDSDAAAFAALEQELAEARRRSAAWKACAKRHRRGTASLLDRMTDVIGETEARAIVHGLRGHDRVGGTS